MLRFYVYSRRGCSTRPKSTFDIDAVTKGYDVRTGWAAANYGNPWQVLLPPRHLICAGSTELTQWIPGFDHAGIATQSVVERHLWKEKALRRDMLSRDQFVEHCKKWSEMNSATIRKQLEILGATLDWQNAYYTLDNKFTSSVNTSLSDQEVNHVDVPSPTSITIPSPQGGKRTVEVGTMYCIRYPLKDSDRFIEVGTTRPETIFADVALAVHPNDERYSQFVGRLVRHPLLRDREIPILADEMVQREKGTGVLKVTPCHDKLDWEIASCHWNEILDVDGTAKTRSCIDDHGRLNQQAGEFAGLDRFDARIKVIQRLGSLGLFSGTLKHEGQIGLCSRTGDIVEPRLTEQWFLDTTDMYASAIEAIKTGKIEISPATQEQRLFDWLSNKDPWCLSRQLLWGHRIPAFRCENSPWFIANSVDDAREHFGKDAVIVQDDDVLDTWFSSSLIPLAMAGWPGQEFNPSTPFLDVMETGWDILGFWVARMIAMTMRLSGGQVPFTRVVLHGLIRDPSGRKMSKSLGNVIDPLDVVNGISQEKMIERVKSSFLPEDDMASAISSVSTRYPNGIPRYGPDALRFALLRHNLFSSDILLNIVDLSNEGYRFCNKLWNMVAYFESIDEKLCSAANVDSGHPADEWIFSRLADTLIQVDEHMTKLTPHLAFAVLYKFILASFCDVYIESTKRAVWER
ncbi:hypothetical protein KIN20_034891 [Parelaphostrongylus tenuis]|uniref:valine--tRNA ligase n=1 Tax=Parelaphostrongylus tenuis TaxID=148309 RepID=A0AAD5WJJ5_PARTN|nr:hypothetical protein KIN20_034891 [Parelaphostrongylus tenuis]